MGPKGPVELAPDERDDKSEAGNRRLRAIFGGRWTHNEQLIMRTCGIILSHGTLFGSEAVSAVNTFAKATFPTPESTPELKSAFLLFNSSRYISHLLTSAGDHPSRALDSIEQIPHPTASNAVILGHSTQKKSSTAMITQPGNIIPF
ncbi:hypothetical protein B0H13DRAFT_2349221 [Mycena leptocephala]|nr:hypothetical protein B0H13DRAFT_2349221 [Mycena leptocephala]